MNSTLKMALAAGLALGSLGFVAESASALPAQGLDNAVAQKGDLQLGVQNVRYVCGYWGCRWVPGYWGYRGYGYGWHRWHHWHHWHHYW
jgi:hypothetical protein